MLKKGNKLLAVLLALALVFTTFGSDFANAKVYADEGTESTEASIATVEKEAIPEESAVEENGETPAEEQEQVVEAPDASSTGDGTQTDGSEVVQPLFEEIPVSGEAGEGESAVDASTEATTEVAADASTEATSEIIEEVVDAATEAPSESKAFEDSVVEDNILITATADAGILPDDAELRVSRVSSYKEEQIEDLIDDTLGDSLEVKETISYDISIYSPSLGDYVQPEKMQKVDVKFSQIDNAIDEVKSSETSLAVFYVDDEVTEAQQVGSAGNTDTEVEFAAEHFSIYTVTVFGKVLNVVPVDWEFLIDTLDSEGNDIGIEKGIRKYNLQHEIFNGDTVAAKDVAPSIHGYEFEKAVLVVDGNEVEISSFNREFGDCLPPINLWADDKYLIKTDTVVTYYYKEAEFDKWICQDHIDVGFTGEKYRELAKNGASVKVVIDGTAYDMGKIGDDSDLGAYEYRFSIGDMVITTDTPIYFVINSDGVEYSNKTNALKDDNYKTLNCVARERCFNSHEYRQGIFGFDFLYDFNEDTFPVVPVEEEETPVTSREEGVSLSLRIKGDRPKDGKGQDTGNYHNFSRNEGVFGEADPLVSVPGFEVVDNYAGGKNHRYAFGDGIDKAYNLTVTDEGKKKINASLLELGYVGCSFDDIVWYVYKAAYDGIDYHIDGEISTVDFTVEYYYSDGIGGYPAKPTSTVSRKGLPGATVTITDEDKKTTEYGYAFDSEKSKNTLSVQLTDDSTKNVLKVYFKKNMEGKPAYFYVLLPDENKNVPKNSGTQAITRFYPLNPYHDCPGVGMDPVKIPYNERDGYGNVYNNNGVDSKYIIEIPDSTKEKLEKFLHDNYDKRYTINNIVWYTYKNANDTYMTTTAWHFDGYVKGVEVSVTYYLNSQTDKTTNKEYTGFLSGNNYTVKDAKDVKADGSTKAFSDLNPGYKFVGWTTKSDGTGEKYAVNETFVLKSNMVLYAQWVPEEYTVTYSYLTDQDKTIAGDAPIDSAKYKMGDPVKTKDAAEVPGYEFCGWTVKSGLDATGTVTEFNMPANNVELVGTYKLSESTKYTVEHYTQNLSGNTEGEWHLEKTEAKTGKTGDAVLYGTDKHYVETTITGFTFDKTQTAFFERTTTSGDKKIKGDATILPNGSLVIKLYYTRNSYNVVYEYDGEVPEGADPSVEKLATNKYSRSYLYGQEVTVADGATAPKHTFDGWKTPDDVTVDNGKFNMPAKDVTIKGSFTRTKKILDIKLDLAEEGSDHEERVYDGIEHTFYVKLKGEITKASETTSQTVPVSDGQPAVEEQTQGAANDGVLNAVATSLRRVASSVADALGLNALIVHAADKDPNSPIVVDYEGETYHIYGIDVTPAKGTNVGTYDVVANINTANIKVYRLKTVDGKTTEVLVNDEFTITSSVEKDKKVGYLKITPAPATVTAPNGLSKVLGTADPAFVPTVSVENNDLYTEAYNTVKKDIAREAGEAVGNYIVMANGYKITTKETERQGNFIVTYVPGTFTIYTSGGGNDDDDTPPSGGDNPPSGGGDPGTPVTPPVGAVLGIQRPRIEAAEEAGSVLGARRPQVLGARRGRTEDSTNTFAHILTIIVAAGTAFAMIALRKKKEEDDK